MNITIYDIAQKCNVSIATVSRVLNGSTRVSEKTRAKVLQVMKEMGYKPNPFARGLGLDSMKIVGVICTDVADIFYAYAVSLLEDGLRKHHFDVMLSNTGSDTGHNGKYISAMADKHVVDFLLIGIRCLRRFRGRCHARDEGLHLGHGVETITGIKSLNSCRICWMYSKQISLIRKFTIDDKERFTRYFAAFIHYSLDVNN